MLIGATEFIHAQGQEPIFKYSMTKYAHTDKVSLRWGAIDVPSWQAGNMYGYKLIRYTLRVDGETLSDSLMNLSKIILMDSMRAIPEAEWEAKADSNRYAGVAAAAIYGDTFEVENISDHPTIKAINRIKEAESRHAFSLMAADMDFTVAKDMGLAYDDTLNLESNKEYLYIITLAGDADTLVLIQGAVSGTISEPDEMELIDSVYASPGDKMAFIGFEIPTQSEYVAYNIQRSSDGGTTFSNINTLPIVPVYGENTHKLSSLDTLADNSTTYIYRVEGINSFGMTGPASDTIHIKGKPARKQYYALIDQGTDLATAGMKITWQFVNVLDTNLIDHVDVYRADRPNEDYIKINNYPLPVSQTEFTDSIPKMTNYYKIKFYDVEGYEYESLHGLVQKEDSIPPSVPTVISGIADLYGNVTLKWNRNAEPDMYGYKVFMSNYRDSLYQMVYDGTTADTFFYTSTELNTLTKKLYYKILAEDIRHNMSELSVAIEVTRPDIVPPSAPVWGYSFPAPDGIHLNFVSSTSEDVAYHKVMRRNKGNRYWTILNTISGVTDGDAYEFVDTTVTLEYTYQYRVVAYDEDNNYSFTETVEFRAFDTGIRGTITDLDIDKVPYDPTTANGIPDSTKVYQYPPSVNVLNWEYTWPDEELFSFEIHRSVNGSPFRVYDVIYVHRQIHTWPQFFNPYRQQGKYFYIDMHMLAKHNGVYGSGSGQQQGQGSGPYPSKTYDYKIIAHHKDGSTSRISSSFGVAVQ